MNYYNEIPPAYYGFTCKSCGTEVKDDDSYCPECLQDIADNRKEEEGMEKYYKEKEILARIKKN